MVKMKMLAVLQLKKYILPHLFVRVKNNVWPLVHQFHWIIPSEKKNETNKTSTKSAMASISSQKLGLDNGTNRRATKRVRGNEEIHSQPHKMGSWVREKQIRVYLSKCIFWNVPGIRTRFSNCSGNCFLNSSATWKESKNTLSPPSTSGSYLHK